MCIHTVGFNISVFQQIYLYFNLYLPHPSTNLYLPHPSTPGHSLGTPPSNFWRYGYKSCKKSCRCDQEIGTEFINYFIPDFPNFGRAPDFSTIGQWDPGISNIIEYFYISLNSSHIVGFIALDVQKAFDVLNHEILCKMLPLYGCDVNSVKWFKSYLVNRVQRVCLNSYESGMCVLCYGVPQGSILGSLLFSIFISGFVLQNSGFVFTKN